MYKFLIYIQKTVRINLYLKKFYMTYKKIANVIFSADSYYERSCNMKHLKDLQELARKQETMILSVAAAEDQHVLHAVVEAAKIDIVKPVLVGNEDKIKSIAKENSYDISSYKIVNTNSLEESAEVAVKLVSSGEADFLMKGLCDTSIIMKAVLNKEWGLRTGKLISHVMVYEVPAYHKLLLHTDGGMNISPDLEQKKQILENALIVAKSLGIKQTKVACVAAKEKVSDKMPATVDAAELQKMAENGEFGDDVIVEGPLALDLAFSKESAKIKNFDSKISGDVDMLLFPNIEMGNGVGKAMTYLANSESAGIIMGASKPIVLVSRADTYEAKLNSIALGSLIASYVK